MNNLLLILFAIVLFVIMIIMISKYKRKTPENKLTSFFYDYVLGFFGYLGKNQPKKHFKIAKIWALSLFIVASTIIFNILFRSTFSLFESIIGAIIISILFISPLFARIIFLERRNKGK